MKKEWTSRTIRIKQSTYEELSKIADDHDMETPDEVVKFLIEQFDQKCMEE